MILRVTTLEALTNVISDDSVVWTNDFLSTMVLEISSVQYISPHKTVELLELLLVVELERVSSITELTG